MRGHEPLTIGPDMDGLILVGVTGGFFAAVVAALCAIAYLTGGPGDEERAEPLEH